MVMEDKGQLEKIYFFPAYYLWSCPDLPTWKRLFLFWIYIPILIWAYVIGKDVIIGRWSKDREKKAAMERIDTK